MSFIETWMNLKGLKYEYELRRYVHRQLCYFNAFLKSLVMLKNNRRSLVLIACGVDMHYSPFKCCDSTRPELSSLLCSNRLLLRVYRSGSDAGQGGQKIPNIIMFIISSKPTFFARKGVVDSCAMTLQISPR